MWKDRLDLMSPPRGGGSYKVSSLPGYLYAGSILSEKTLTLHSDEEPFTGLDLNAKREFIEVATEITDIEDVFDEDIDKQVCVNSNNRKTGVNVEALVNSF